MPGETGLESPWWVFKDRPPVAYTDMGMNKNHRGKLQEDQILQHTPYEPASRDMLQMCLYVELCVQQQDRWHTYGSADCYRCLQR